MDRLEPTVEESSEPVKFAQLFSGGFVSAFGVLGGESLVKMSQALVILKIEKPSFETHTSSALPRT
jgi:hypothetical protein